MGPGKRPSGELGHFPSKSRGRQGKGGTRQDKDQGEEEEEKPKSAPGMTKPSQSRGSPQTAHCLWKAEVAIHTAVLPGK